METTYTVAFTVMPSQADLSGRLSVPDTFNLFMDVATQAAGALGVGMDFLRRKGMFWITVKTHIEFINRPALLETVRVSTWPEAPAEKRCNRHYVIAGADGAAMVRGKTEWAIVSALTRRPQRMADILPAGLDYAEAPACPEPFPMIDEDFPEPPFYDYRVAATDIDMARHMNNVAYVRAIVNAFSTKEWGALNVRAIDVIFRSSAHEGDVLRFQKRRSGDALDIRGCLPDGGTSVLARLRLG